MYGRARVPGACGELVQGMIDGDYFLITCPINLGSEVRVSLQPGGQVTGPGEKGKALRAVRLTLDHLAAPGVHGWISTIPCLQVKDWPAVRLT